MQQYHEPSSNDYQTQPMSTRLSNKPPIFLHYRSLSMQTQIALACTALASLLVFCICSMLILGTTLPLPSKVQMTDPAVPLTITPSVTLLFALPPVPLPPTLTPPTPTPLPPTLTPQTRASPTPPRPTLTSVNGNPGVTTFILEPSLSALMPIFVAIFAASPHSGGALAILCSAKTGVMPNPVACLAVAQNTEATKPSSMSTNAPTPRNWPLPAHTPSVVVPLGHTLCQHTRWGAMRLTIKVALTNSRPPSTSLTCHHPLL